MREEGRRAEGEAGLRLARARRMRARRPLPAAPPAPFPAPGCTPAPRATAPADPKPRAPTLRPRAAPLFCPGRQKWRAVAWAAASISLSIAVTMMYVELSYVQSEFMTALSGKDAKGFKRAVLKYAGVVAGAAPLFALFDWVEDRFRLAWRNWLTG